MLQEFEKVTGKKRVPNLFPTNSQPVPYRIAFIGEAPGQEEEEWRTCVRGHEFPKIAYDSQSRKTITNISCTVCGNPSHESTAKPFVGASGRFLTSLLIDAGIDRKTCFLGNVCQFRPPDNKIESFAWSSFEIQQSLELLKEDI